MINSVPLMNMKYVRNTSWHDGAAWSVSKNILQINQTVLPEALLDLFKRHARIDSSEDDGYIKLLLDAAIQSIEDYTGLIIRPTTYQWRVEGFSSCYALQIDKNPVHYLSCTDTSTVPVDITSLCKANATTEDHMWYFKPPDDYKDFILTFGAGFTDDPADTNVWIIPNPWALPNAWAFSNSTLDFVPILRHAILVLTTEFFENRQLTTTLNSSNIPSLVQHLLTPIKTTLRY